MGKVCVTLVMVFMLASCAAQEMSPDYQAYINAAKQQKPMFSVELTDDGKIKSMTAYAPAQPVQQAAPHPAWQLLGSVAGPVIYGMTSMFGSYQSRLATESGNQMLGGMVGSLAGNNGVHFDLGDDASMSLADSWSTGDPVHTIEAPVVTTPVVSNPVVTNPVVTNPVVVTKP